MTQASAKKSPRKPVSPASKPTKSTKSSKPALPLKASTAEGTAVKPVRSVQVKRSGVHGKGVFAGRAFAKGETIIEYKGEVITWEEANRRHPHDPKDPNHTFYFHLDDHWVIDGKFNGNAARWINHACDPNCEADEDDGRVFIKALRPIEPGQELFYDYGLVIDERITKKLKKEYACWCGSPKCRGTMLSGRK
ncbi:MAG: SET domain-containing protein [Aquabacterium sp.]|jgi:SET domain-containing protein|nr:MAG: SET domain-containing protein [Aquabacterium sp.]